MSSKCSKFVEFLLDRVEKYDEEILKSLHPQDSWVGCFTGSMNPDWWNTREHVRHIVEGLAFKSSDPVNYWDDRIESDDRFTSVFPDLNQEWKNL